jgi:hypothetical protein
MSLQLLRNVNFGRTHSNQTGSMGVGYALLDQGGTIVASRTTTGVYQLMVDSGLYASLIDFPDNFRGQVVWDCPAFTGSLGVVSQSFAAEQFNIEENDPRVGSTEQMLAAVTGTIQSIYDMGFGRWKINKSTNQMLFFAADNVTPIATFNLYDDAGAPAFDGVFERQKV